MAVLTEAFGMVLTAQNFMMMLIGVVIGLVFGAIPGLTYMTGILLVLPMTFGLDSISAVSILLGVYCAGMCGGSTSAILLGIPGTPSAAATVLDGYPLSKKGHADKSLGMALFSSVMGGLISLVILSIAAPLIANATRHFGAAERFALVFMGLTCICRVSSGNMLKGVISGILGVMITFIGLDPVMGVQRYTFGNLHLMGGINLLPVLIGMFAIPEIIKCILHKNEVKIKDTRQKISLPTLKEFRYCFPTILKSTFIGTLIGAIPGTGGPTACFLSYDQAQRDAKKRGDEVPFGEGNILGVAAPEAANNGVTGGAMIPMLTMGVPGDGTTAVIMGAFMIHGLQPGPMLFSKSASTVYAIFMSMFIINIMVLIVQSLGIRIFVKVLDIPIYLLNGIILALCVVGAFSQNNTYFDVIVVAAAGLLCYLLGRAGFSTTPLLLGVALGKPFEENFRLALNLSSGDYTVFFRRPICLVILIITLLIVVVPPISERLTKKKAAIIDTSED